jgi:phosphomannomutase
MEEFLGELKTKVSVGLVGGSDLAKIAEQMGGQGDNTSQACIDIAQKFHYLFAENGLVAYKSGAYQESETIQSYMGEEKLQKFINFCLRYMSDLVLPFKRGNFIEFRTGLINICPVGRSCSQNEREQFAEFDKTHKVREKFVAALNEEFSDLGLAFVIGGQISIDAFPRGWDKTFCLQYLTHFDKVYFFGDKTFPGGNDYEIFNDSRTIGYTVTSPEHTRQILKQLFF